MSWASDFLNSDSSGNQPLSQEGALTKAIKPTGLFETPILGGLLRGIVPGAEVVGQAGVDVSDTLTGQKGRTNQIMSPQMASDLGPNKSALDVGMTGAGTGLNAGLSVDALAGAPGIAKGAVNLAKEAPNVASVITGRGLWPKMVDSAKNAIDWGSVTSRALSNAKNEIQPVKDAITKILSEEGPKSSQAIKSGESAVGQTSQDLGYTADTSSTASRLPTKEEILQQTLSDTGPRGNPTYNISGELNKTTGPEYWSPSGQSTAKLTGAPATIPAQSPSMEGIDALEKRAAIGKSIPKGFWTGRSNLDSYEARAYAHVRDALSQELKLSNPALEKADKMYGMHQALKTAAPRLAGAIGIPAAGVAGYDLLKELLSGSGQNQNAQ